jgi:putative membrane protein
MLIAQAIPFAHTWMHGGWGWGWMSLMMFGTVLFWAAVIFGVVWLIRNTVDRRPEPRSESPLEVLERRFAEGTISAEDYQSRREVLLNGSVRQTVPTGTSR